MTSAISLRRPLAAYRPVAQGYDEEEFARRLHDGRPIAVSVDAGRAARQTSVEILDRIELSEWSCDGTHAEGGRYTIEARREIDAAHCHDHAEQIRRTALP